MIKVTERAMILRIWTAWLVRYVFTGVDYWLRPTYSTLWIDDFHSLFVFLSASRKTILWICIILVHFLTILIGLSRHHQTTIHSIQLKLIHQIRFIKFPIVHHQDLLQQLITTVTRHQLVVHRVVPAPTLVYQAIHRIHRWIHRRIRLIFILIRLNHRILLHRPSKIFIDHNNETLNIHLSLVLFHLDPVKSIKSQFHRMSFIHGWKNCTWKISFRIPMEAKRTKESERLIHGVKFLNLKRNFITKSIWIVDDALKLLVR